MQSERVFEIGGEGGSLCIIRQITESGEVFIYHHSEFDPTGEGEDIDRSYVCKTFDEAFDHIDHSYAWYNLYIINLHPAYREAVIKRLISKLNKSYIPDSFYNNIRLSIKESLQIDLVYNKQQGSEFAAWSISW
jgi:hypothetical protein